MKKKPIKKYQYGGGVQPSTATPVGGMLGGLSALAKPGVTGSVSAQDRPSVPSSMGPMPSMGPLPAGAQEKIAAMGASYGMGSPGVVQPGPRPGMGRPGMGRPVMGRPGMGKPGTGGVNVGVRPLPMPVSRSMNAMGPGSMVMPTGRAFAKGGMVGCDWFPKSSATMRGAARKGK